MTPEERRELRRSKVLQRSEVSEQHFASALMNNNVSELVSNPQIPNTSTPESSHSIKTGFPTNEVTHLTSGNRKNTENTFDAREYLKSQDRQNKLRSLKTFSMIVLGLISSFFVFNENFNKHSNLFLIFMLVDVSINIMFFREKMHIDSDQFSPALSGFIKVLEKMVS